eukprot:664351-Amphidinium_carterae.2
MENSETSCQTKRETYDTEPLHCISSTALTSHGSSAAKAKWTSRADANYFIEFSTATYRHYSILLDKDKDYDYN